MGTRSHSFWLAGPPRRKTVSKQGTLLAPCTTKRSAGSDTEVEMHCSSRRSFDQEGSFQFSFRLRCRMRAIPFSDAVFILCPPILARLASEGVVLHENRLSHGMRRGT